jgi:hypothetical protein
MDMILNLGLGIQKPLITLFDRWLSPTDHASILFLGVEGVPHIFHLADWGRLHQKALSITAVISDEESHWLPKTRWYPEIMLLEGNLAHIFFEPGQFDFIVSVTPWADIQSGWLTQVDDWARQGWIVATQKKTLFSGGFTRNEANHMCQQSGFRKAKLHPVFPNRLLIQVNKNCF